MIQDFLLENVNPAAAGIMGRPQSELPGASVRHIFPDSPDDGTYPAGSS